MAYNTQCSRRGLSSNFKASFSRLSDSDDQEEAEEEATEEEEAEEDEAKEEDIEN